MKRLGLMLEQSRDAEKASLVTEDLLVLSTARRCRVTTRFAYAPSCPVFYEGEPFTPRRALDERREIPLCEKHRRHPCMDCAYENERRVLRGAA